MPSVRIRLPGSEPSTGANAAEHELDGGNHFGDALRSVGDGNRLVVDVLKREHAVEGSLASLKCRAGGHHLISVFIALGEGFFDVRPKPPQVKFAERLWQRIELPECLVESAQREIV